VVQSPVLRWIEIIGEAARALSDELRDAHPADRHRATNRSNVSERAAFASACRFIDEPGSVRWTGSLVRTVWGRIAA